MVSVKNVHIFPGVPRLFEALVSEFLRTQLSPELRHQTPMTRRNLGVFVAEGDLADPLRHIQLQCPLVNIGSYPRWITSVASTSSPSSSGSPSSSNGSPSSSNAGGVDETSEVRVVVTLEGVSPEEVERGVRLVKERFAVVELP